MGSIFRQMGKTEPEGSTRRVSDDARQGLNGKKQDAGGEKGRGGDETKIFGGGLTEPIHGPRHQTPLADRKARGGKAERRSLYIERPMRWTNFLSLGGVKAAS